MQWQSIFIIENFEVSSQLITRIWYEFPIIEGQPRKLVESSLEIKMPIQIKILHASSVE
jgi:hypothetical protein